MDNRNALHNGACLHLDQREYILEGCIGRGSNALVYQAYYHDSLQPQCKHYVLIKELFPYQRDALIFRHEAGHIVCLPDALEWFMLNKESFLRGNRMHMQFLSNRNHGAIAGGNINSCEANGTCYSILSDSGGITLKDALDSSRFIPTPRGALALVQSLLDVLAVYHQGELMHLDISPDNILLLPQDRHQRDAPQQVLLIDYNSMWSRSELQADPNLFLSMKEGYSPPELRLKDRRCIGPWTDLYAVCAVLKELWAASKTQDIPATAQSKAESILRKGLRSAPQSRYQSVSDLQTDLAELRDRLLCLGVTHAALWEQSRSQFSKLVAGNPHYAYLKEDLLFEAPDMPSCDTLLTAQGGMGKTTTLFLWWKAGMQAYNPNEPVPIYIPLYRCQPDAAHSLRHLMLERLRFDERTGTLTDALTKLDTLLDTPSSGRTIQLLLDGLNEAPGDQQALLQEIKEIAMLRGVTVILTSRSACPALDWPVFELSPLPPEKVQSTLSSHGLLYPQLPATHTLLSNPMLLSLYIQAARHTEKKLDVFNHSDILSLYIQGLADKQKALNATQAGQAQYAAAQFLPALALHMHNDRKISPDQLYAFMRKLYRQVKGAFFRKAYPQYIGQIKSILASSSSPEEWFSPMVDDMLVNRLALLVKDEQGNYCFSHPLFQEHFEQAGKPVLRRLRAAVFRHTAPFVLAGLLTACMLLLLVQTVLPRTYPATPQEQTQVKNALDGLLGVIVSLDSQITTTQGALQQWLTSGDDAVLITLLTQQQVQAQAYLPSQSKLDRMTAYFEKWPLAVDSSSLDLLMNAPTDYYNWTQANLTRIKDEVLSSDSIYPQGDKSFILSAYADYIDLYTQWCFDQIMKVIEPLNQNGRSQALEILRTSPLFFQYIAQMQLDPPTDTQRAELSAQLQSLYSRSKALLGSLYEKGFHAADLMQSK